MSDAIRPITMPKWGLAMDEGEVVAWLAEEGAAIESGQEVLEIETTKITNVFESPVSGTLRRRVVAEGEIAPVGALLGVVAEAGVSDAEVEAFVEDFLANFDVAAAAEAEAAPEPEMIEAGDWRLNVLRTGGGDLPPLVLIHGFGGDLNNWLFNQPALSEEREVIALDLPGHGRSQKDVGAGDLAALGGAVGALLDGLELGKAHLAGHSLGGAGALTVALDRPERVAALTLVAPAGLGPEINGDYISGFIAAGRRKEMKGVLQQLFADESLVSRDMIEDILKYKRLDGAEAALKAIAGAAFPEGRQATVLRERLGDLACPVQAVWGVEDRIVPAAHGEGLPGSIAVHRLEGIGHMAHMEAAGEVNRLIGALGV